MTADAMTDRASRFLLTAAERGKVAPRKFAHVVI
jgi:hypothetical protein